MTTPANPSTNAANAERPDVMHASPASLAIIAAVESMRAQITALNAQCDALLALASARAHMDLAVASAARVERAARSARESSAGGLPPVFGQQPSTGAVHDDRQKQQHAGDPLDRID